MDNTATQLNMAPYFYAIYSLLTMHAPSFVSVLTTQWKTLFPYHKFEEEKALNAIDTRTQKNPWSRPTVHFLYCSLAAYNTLDKFLFQEQEINFFGYVNHVCNIRSSS